MRVTQLVIHRDAAEARRLRQPRVRAEPQPVAPGGPGQGDASAVATQLLALGAEEGGILAALCVQSGVLRQPQLIALVDVCGTRQGQFHECGGAGAAKAQIGLGLFVFGADSIGVGGAGTQSVA